MGKAIQQCWGDLMVSDLSKSLVYIDDHGEKREKILLDNISFHLPGGSILALLGRSGSGKSVFLRCLLNLFPPRGGQVFFRQRIFDNEKHQETTDLQFIKDHSFSTDMSTLYAISGVVFQGYGLFDDLTVGENILFPLIHKENQRFPLRSLFFGKSYDIHKLETFGKNLLKNVGLDEDLFGAPISSLSGGMKRRVAIARGLSNKPQYLFFDEPTEGLDPLTGRDITLLIKDIHKREKTTTIIITHDPQQALYLADYIALMDKGKLIFFNKKELLDKEAPYNVKEFLSMRY